MSEVVSKLVEVLQGGVREGVFPGAGFAVGNAQHIWTGFAGRTTYDPDSPEVGPDHLWDMASTTKVLATTSVAMMLFDDGALSLEARVSHILPDFLGDQKPFVKVRDLLLHESGLPAYANLVPGFPEPEAARERVHRLALVHDPGSRTVYSCMGFIALQSCLEKVSGEPLDQLLSKRLFEPLGLHRTCYNPTPDQARMCVPTERLDDTRRQVEDRRGWERLRDDFIQGRVHDPAAMMVGGVSGNAGLFSTPAEAGRILQVMLREGAAEGRQVFCARTVREWTTRNSGRSTRALGWDTKSPEGSSAGKRFSSSSFGHTGFTGTSVWVDPEDGLFAVLLSNRVHPTSQNTAITDFRPTFHDEVHRLLAPSSGP